MNFASDNAGPVPAKVLEALAEANTGYAMAYGADPLTEEVTERLRLIFEAPQAAVYLVATGTAANALALSCMARPFDTVFCSPHAHIHTDECNAPEFYTAGAKLTLVGEGDRMTPADLRATIEGEENRGVHGPARGPVSLTQTTEGGNVYSLDALRDLTGVAQDFGLAVHMDGARFANALVALGCSPAEMTWKAGVDVLSFGGTKNGLLGAEAVIFFNPDAAAEFELRRKRAGHLFSKHRYLAAQMAAYLRDGLWLELAARANAATARLADGLRRQEAVRIENDPRANIIFARAPRHLLQRAHAAGAAFSMWGDPLDGEDPDKMLLFRLVCDWSVAPEQVDRFLSVIGQKPDV